MMNPQNPFEKWQPIHGFEGLYEVSDQGRVRSVNRVESVGDHFRSRRGKVLKPLPTRDGYFRVALLKIGRPKYVGVHILVLMAYGEKKPGPLYQCNHRNGIKSDNRIGNLEWLTASENVRHAFANGLKFGTPHHMKKVIRSDGRIFDSIRSAAKQIGSAHQGIINVLRGRRKTCKGFGWAYFRGNG